MLLVPGVTKSFRGCERIIGVSLQADRVDKARRYVALRCSLSAR